MKPAWATNPRTPTKRKPRATVPPATTQPDAPQDAALKQDAASQPDATLLHAGGRDVAAPEPAQDVPEWQGPYLAALEKNGGQKVAAADAAGVARSTVMRRRHSNSEFERLENEVMQASFDAAESEARRRAIDGVESKTRVVSKEGNVYETTERKYSDTILLRLLERMESGTWRQKLQMEHSGGLTFKTRAERKQALEAARAAMTQQPVTAVNGRS